MLVTLSKPTAGGYYPETIQVDKINWDNGTAILIVANKNISSGAHAVEFAQTFGYSIAFKSDFCEIAIKSEYIDTIIF